MWNRIAKYPQEALLLSIGLVGTAVLALLAIGEYPYLVHGVATSATVIDVHVRRVGFRAVNDSGGGGQLVYEQRIRYEYQDQEGSTFVGETAAFFEGASRLYHKGQAVSIQYLHPAPATSRLTPSWRRAAPPWGILLAALGLGAGIVALAAWWTRHDSLLDLLSRLGARSLSARFQQRRRAKVLRDPFPYTWLVYLRKNVRVYSLLTPAEQDKLQNDLRIFIADKHWQGCGGLVITDEIKVTIAAQACLLLLGIEHDYFRPARTILIYPSGFRTRTQHVSPDGILVEGDAQTLGQAWYRGPVVLAWDEVLAGGQNHQDGQNVVFHEFAHQLDFMGAWFDRPPLHRPREQYQQWQEVMTAEYQQLVQDCEQARATLLDPYGATSPAEFFAVATECFFEQPQHLQRQHPRLYEVLRDFYGQDPARRFTYQ